MGLSGSSRCCAPWDNRDVPGRVDAPGVAAVLGGDLGAALEGVRIPTWINDTHGVIRWQNARARTVFGDLVGRTVESVAAPESRAQIRAQRMKKVLGSASVTDYDAVLMLGSGEEARLELHTVALADDGHVVGVFGIAEEPERARLRPPANPLTPRQHEVLYELARGRSTLQIAGDLHLSHETVRNYIRALLRRLNVHSRLEAVAKARELGLVD